MSLVELGGFDIGIAIGTQSLAFGPWRDTGWQALAASPNEVLRPRALAAGSTVSLQIDQRRVALPRDPPDLPQLTCASDGLLPPFVLAMSGPGTVEFRLVSDGAGGLGRERVDVR